MILQTDERLRGEIHTAGSYYMCLIDLAREICGKTITPPTINEKLYYEAIREGWMTQGCWVNNPSAIVNCVTKGKPTVVYTGVHERPSYTCKEDEWEILYYKRGDSLGHFVRGDGQGNVTYDPMGESMSVKEGTLKSKRIFRRI
jgi:hypothetical protein